MGRGWGGGVGVLGEGLYEGPLRRHLSSADLFGGTPSLAVPA